MTTPPAPSPARLYVYVGHGNATGEIDIFSFDPATGALAELEVVPSGSSTSFFALHPNRQFAYTTQNRRNRISEFAVDPATGHLRWSSDAAVPPKAGEAESGPCYATVDARGKFLLVANYRGNNTVVYRLMEDGGIGPIVSNVSDGNQAHCVRLSPDNRFAFVPYLGSDIIAQYRFDEATGALTPNDPPTVATAAGAGPRHMVFAPNGCQAFVVNELDATLTSYAYDADAGTLSPLITVTTLPAGYDGRRWAGDIQVHPTGRWVYVSNRAHDSISVFEVGNDASTLTLLTRAPCGGKTPRNFTLTPRGTHMLVANQDSGNLVTFAIDTASGRMTQTADLEIATAPYFVRVVDLA